MAGIVREYYTWMPTVKLGTTLVQDALVMVWDLTGAKHTLIPLITEADGQLFEPLELKQAEHSITGTDTVATTDFTPHKIRTLFYGNTDLDPPNGIYGCRVDEFSKDVARQASVNTIFLDLDPGLTIPENTVNNWTGIAFNHSLDTLTLTLARSITDIYQLCAGENYVAPEYTPTEFMSSIDQQNFIMYYDLIINNVVLTGQGKSVRFDGTKKLTFQTGASLSGSLTVIGDVVWGTTTTLANLTVQDGTLDFTAAGTYNLTDCNIAEVTNSSGGAVTINALGTTTITTNTGPNITVNNSKSFKFTVNPSITGYEWRVYNVTALGSLAGAVEQDGEESAIADNQTYVYNYTVDQPIAVQIIPQPDADYEEKINYYTLSNVDQDVTINLTRDDNN